MLVARKTAGIQRMCRTALFACICLCMSGLLQYAHAHMVTSFNIRVVHFDYVEGGMLAYFRLSLPLVAGAQPAPYIIELKESGQLFHYADTERIRRDTAGLGSLIAQGHAVTLNGNPVVPQVLVARAHAKGSVPPFNTLAQARAAVEGPSLPLQTEELDAAHVLVDAALFYPGIAAGQSFTMSSTLDPERYGTVETRNLMFSHLGNDTVRYSASGLLTQALSINPPLADAVRQFVIAGITHILEGADHLLFIVCLVIGDMRLRTIAWRVTGFSVGHSLSLLAGFHGLIPAAGWFPPLVEAMIALSVLAASIALLLPRPAARMTVPLATLAGLAHGLGFAFGLREMLGESGPNVIGSLVSFNLGVEIGQLVVAATIWAGLRLIIAQQHAWSGRLHKPIALASALVSLVWLVQRIPPVLAA